MSEQRSSFPLIFTAGIAAVVLVLAWMMLTLASDRSGVRNLLTDNTSKVEWLVDFGRKLDLAGARSTPLAAWRPWEQPITPRTGPGNAIWMRVTVHNPAPGARLGILADTYSYTDLVDCWTELSDGRWEHLLSGQARSGAEKPLWSRSPAFPISVPGRSGQVVYLRASDYYFSELKLEWWPRAEDFFSNQLRNTLLECMCYGALIALLLYNLVLWLRLRYPDTGYYLLYGGSLATFNFVSNGGPTLLGWPSGSPGNEIIIYSALLVSGIFVAQFARVFLNTASSVPLGHRALRWAQCGLAALLVAAALAPWLRSRPESLWITAAVFLTAATHFIALGAAVAAWRNGEHQARFFVVAFGLLVLGGVPMLIAWLTDDNVPGMERGFLAGSTLEMVLLSFAVADRFAQAQRQLIEETKQRRMIEATYLDELEVEVRERTRELRLANADKDRMLAVIGHDLRGPLAGLMQAADRTTGPFAQETTRTGRALLLLIEDLVLWARLRAGTRVLGTHPASGVLLPAVALHRSLAESGGIELVVQVTEELRVRTDLVLVQTLVRNLLANALKFARRTVVLRAEADAEHNVRFSVGNDGPSLSPDLAARFASGTDETMTATGGLGLRLCREICRALGMQLEARTPAEGGTEFSFTVKSATAAAAASSS